MDKIRIPIGLIIYTACISDLIYSMVITRAPYLNNSFKPIVVLLFLPTIRNNLKTVVLDLKDSLPVLAMIFAFIFFFSFSGYFLFQGTLEGVTTFPNINSSYYNMLILLTTANFPDVMLPAYNYKRFNFFFFFLFLVFGLYFLLNVLLAVVFDNYKSKLEDLATKKTDVRGEYIEQFYDKFDED